MFRSDTTSAVPSNAISATQSDVPSNAISATASAVPNLPISVAIPITVLILVILSNTTSILEWSL